MGIYVKKLSWPAIAAQATKLYGKQISAQYAYDVYRGQHKSAKLLEIITKIIQDDPQSAERGKELYEIKS